LVSARPKNPLELRVQSTDPKAARVLNTSNWPQIDLDVLKELHLDPRNVRLEISDAKVEADILEDLFVNEGALSLVEAICTVGYLTHDVPVAIKRGRKYVMVEGNRRLAALKAIQNPQLVPTHRSQIAAFANRLDDRKALARIQVMLAPNQTEADQLIAAIHTGNPRKPWTPARQAAFFQAQIDSGKKYKTLLSRYPTIDVRKFVFRAQMLNAFRNAQFKDPALSDFLASKEWTRGLSVLARVYESRDFLELTGFKMDDDGKLTRKISKTYFDEMASIIIDGMRAGDLSTRSLNSVHSPRFRRLMEELQAVVEPPARSHRGKGSDSGSATGKGSRGRKDKGSEKGKRNPPAPPPPRPGRKRHFLDMSQIILPDSYPSATKLCVRELSVVDVQDFPNAAFLLMRAVLEKTIKSFADAKGQNIKNAGNDHGRVQLGHALKWLLQFVQAEGPKSLIQPIERVRDGKLLYMSSSHSMNAVNHNHEFSADPDEALNMWDAIDPLMKFAIRP
jgi:hypothetical protein